MSNPTPTNPYLSQPFQTPVTSWFQSLTSGVALSYLLANFTGGPSTRRSNLTRFLLGTGVVHLLPRLLNYTTTNTRRAALTQLAATKLQHRNDRRNALRSAVVMTDLKLEAHICSLMAHQLLEKMRNKTYTCEAVVRAFCSRALRLGEMTGAVTDELYDSALARAREIDVIRSQPNHDVTTEPPLFGLPFSTKDQINIQGYDSTAGAQVRVFAPATADAAVVALLRDAGGIPFVKSNVPQR